MHDYSNIPAVLCGQPRWILYASEWSEEKQKLHKEPRNPRSPWVLVSTKKPDQWVTFEEAVASAEKLGEGFGVGYVLTGDRSIIGYDLDRCLDELQRPNEFAQEILSLLSGAYCEVSPSGRGLRFICEGTLDEGDWQNHDVGIEVYNGSAPRFLTMTGDVWPGYEELRGITTNHEEIRARYYKHQKGQGDVEGGDMPDLVDAIPGVEKGDLSAETWAFWSQGEADDRSTVMFWLAKELVQRWGKEVTLALMWDNTHCREAALEHRRNDEDRALLYLWENCIRPVVVKHQVTKVAEAFEDLGEDPEAPQVNYRKALPFQRQVGKKWVPISCIENLEEILSRLGVVVRYDVMKKRAEYLIPGQAFSLDNADNCSLAFLISECGKFGMPTGQVPEFLELIADRNQFNPVVAWIDSTPWDGEDRLQALYDSIEATETPLKETMIRRWLVGAVRAAYSADGLAGQGVLVLQGDQGLGKTRWFSHLVPLEMGLTRAGVFLRPSDKDSVAQACQNWICELGELDATFRKSDISQLKAFLTNHEDVYRAPYARKQSRYPRRTVFFGSVNPDDFLHDATGGRRFWVLGCERINWDHGIDTQQLWAQVKTLADQGEPHWLEADELQDLNLGNENFAEVNPIVELLAGGLEWNAPKAQWRRISSLKLLNELGKRDPTSGELSRCGHYMKKRTGRKSEQTSDGRLVFAPPLRGSFPYCDGLPVI